MNKGIAFALSACLAITSTNPPLTVGSADEVALVEEYDMELTDVAKPEVIVVEPTKEVNEITVTRDGAKVNVSYVDEVIELPPVEPKPEPEIYLTDAEIDLIALVTMAEAEGESEEGQRLVIDTILNRVEHPDPHFPDTVTEVIYQPAQFSPMWNGRINRCYVREDIRQLVIEEMYSRTNRDVIFFYAGRYSIYGEPMFSVGGHYFSSYEW